MFAHKEEQPVQTKGQSCTRGTSQQHHRRNKLGAISDMGLNPASAQV